MKIRTTVHIHFTKYSWESEGEFTVNSYVIKDDPNHAYVGPQDIEVEVPKNFDPRVQQVAALEAQKQKLMADFQRSVTIINDRITKLQAIEYTA